MADAAPARLLDLWDDVKAGSMTEAERLVSEMNATMRAAHERLKAAIDHLLRGGQ